MFNEYWKDLPQSVFLKKFDSMLAQLYLIEVIKYLLCTTKPTVWQSSRYQKNLEVAKATNETAVRGKNMKTCVKRMKEIRTPTRDLTFPILESGSH